MRVWRAILLGHGIAALAWMYAMPRGFEFTDSGFWNGTAIPGWVAASALITLAGTSVGRGWNAVAHAPGEYRNRLEIGPP
jgi:hypothetical protein